MAHARLIRKRFVSASLQPARTPDPSRKARRRALSGGGGRGGEARDMIDSHRVRLLTRRTSPPKTQITRSISPPLRICAACASPHDTVTVYGRPAACEGASQRISASIHQSTDPSIHPSVRSGPPTKRSKSLGDPGNGGRVSGEQH